MRTRFAPSPTGYLHTGNARVALLNYFSALKENGYFLLRVDDTDQERSKAIYEDAIKDDLAWLGITWNECFRQSERMGRYNEIVEKLKDMGRLYACYETPEELDLKRKSRLNRGLPPIYDRAHYTLSDSDKKAFEAEGRKPHWRFYLEEEIISWQDHIHGAVEFGAGHVSDPVLLRSDNQPLYTLTSVVDDGDYNISLIIRGEDHLVNTAVQVQLFKVLQMSVPAFGHIPRMMDEHGGKLSKRQGALSLRDLQGQAILPETIKAYLTRIGSNIAASIQDNDSHLLQDFALSNYGRAQPKFISQDLLNINSKMLHKRPFADIEALLTALKLPVISESMWQLLGNNIAALEEVNDWIPILSNSFTPPKQTNYNSLLQYASDNISEADISEPKTWLKNIGTHTQHKGKDLFMPIRFALSGRHDGPTVGELIQYLGLDEVKRRLKESC